MSRAVDLAYHVFDGALLGVVATMQTPTRGKLTPTSEVLQRDPSIDWIFTGPIFDDGARLRYRMFDRAAGIDLQPQGIYRDKGATLNYARGELFFLENSEKDPQATVAIQGGFSIVINGAVAYPDKPGHYDNAAVWRCGLGLLSDGRGVFTIGKQGIRSFAQTIVNTSFDGASAVRVVYTDGGHSAILRNRDGSFLYGFTGNDPRIFNWCVLRNRNAPIHSQTSSTRIWPWVVGGVGATIAVGGGLWYAKKKRLL